MFCTSSCRRVKLLPGAVACDLLEKRASDIHLILMSPVRATIVACSAAEFHAPLTGSLERSVFCDRLSSSVLLGVMQE